MSDSPPYPNLLIAAAGAGVGLGGTTGLAWTLQRSWFLHLDRPSFLLGVALAIPCAALLGAWIGSRRPSSNSRELHAGGAIYAALLAALLGFPCAARSPADVVFGVVIFATLAGLDALSLRRAAAKLSKE